MMPQSGTDSAVHKSNKTVELTLSITQLSLLIIRTYSGLSPLLIIIGCGMECGGIENCVGLFAFLLSRLKDIQAKRLE